MSTQFVLLNGFRVLYYLPVRVLGRYQTIFSASQTTLAGSGEAIRNNSFLISGLYLIHFRPHERDQNPWQQARISGERQSGKAAGYK
jgi:hypothetical protein